MKCALTMMRPNRPECGVSARTPGWDGWRSMDQSREDSAHNQLVSGNCKRVDEWNSEGNTSQQDNVVVMQGKSPKRIYDLLLFFFGDESIQTHMR